MVWRTSYCENVGVEVSKKIQDNLCCVLFPIICVKYHGIAYDAKYFLQLVGNEVRSLSWQRA